MTKLNGRPALKLLESDVRRAMEHTLSNAAAARFLSVSKKTYKKYALQYLDADGISLYEKHKNPTGKNCKWSVTYSKGERFTTQDIVAGKAPRYPLSKLKPRLFRDCLKAEECEECGANEKRVTDYTAPLLLHQEDGDRSNYSLDNLKVYCYNCYYLYVGSITYRVNNKELKKKEIEDQIDDDMYEHLRSL